MYVYIYIYTYGLRARDRPLETSKRPAARGNAMLQKGVTYSPYIYIYIHTYLYRLETVTNIFIL